MQVDKEILRETILGLEAEQLSASKANYQQYLANAQLNLGEVRDAQDQSQTQQVGDYAELFDAPIHTHEEAIEFIKGLDFSTTSTVQAGAVVKWAGQNFVISALTDEFECQGETFMGISCDAPITAALLGKSAGESFELSGATHQIEDVY